MRISIDEIKNNMIIDQDIYNSNGKLILSRGLSISDDEFIKNLLRKNAIDKIKVLLLFEGETEKEEIPLSFDEIKKQDIEEFINNFENTINDFKDEILSSLTGDYDKKNLERMLQETISSNTNKSVNVFQLLQKFKNSDDVIFTHCNSVSLTAYTIGKWLKLSDKELKDLSLAGLLLDIGKHSIPKDILNKVEPITQMEYEILKTHVEKSLEMLKPYELNNDVIDAIKYHHERCDGSGYPYGLKGEQIPFLAKVLALADVFVALTSKRPYRNKMTPFKASKLLETDFMQKLDIVVLSDFINRIASTYIGAILNLSDGRVCEILFINSNSPLRPIVKTIPQGDIVDLSAKVNSHIDIQEFI